MQTIKTPYFEFDKEVIRDNYLRMKEALDNCRLFYAMKPNFEYPVLEALIDCNASFEAASEGEMDRLLELKVNMNRIICSLPVKKSSMIQHLYQHGCRYFVFDCYEEYLKLLEYAPAAKKILRIDTNDIIPSNISFGMSYREFEELCMKDEAFSNHMDGLTFYILGNQDIDNLTKVIEKCRLYLRKIKRKNLLLNIGGNYMLPQLLPDNFYRRLRSQLLELKYDYGVILYAEPGRAFVKTAGKLMTEVALVKEKGDYFEVFIDAGQQTKVSYKPENITIQNREYKGSETKITYKFFGTLCAHVELFEMQLNFNIKQGDILVFHAMGAYTICFSNRWHGSYLPEIRVTDSRKTMKLRDYYDTREETDV